ncbi:MAG: hypothetical protein ABMA13_23535 [Chthoniobacteraceae bacterium]
MQNIRTLIDQNLASEVNLPAAGASAVTPVIDTATETPGRLENIELLVELPATASLVEAKDITLTLKDSADGETFAALAEVPAIVVTGAAEAAGGGAVASRFKIPIACRRYLRLDAEVEAAGGDNTDALASFKFVF